EKKGRDKLRGRLIRISPCTPLWKNGAPDILPSSQQSRLTIAAFTDLRVSVRQYQASADRAGVAPEAIDGRVGLTAVLQTAQGSLIDAGAFGHDRQGQPGCLAHLLQLVHEAANEKIGAAFDRPFVGAAGLQFLLSRAVLQFVAESFMPG